MFSLKSTFSFALLALLTPAAFASPTPGEHQLAKRGAVLTAQYATESEAGGRYILGNNLWGKSADPSGSQSSQATAVNGNSVTWHTTYKWGGSNSQVKSYANLDMRFNLNKQLSSISSIPTSWSWSYGSASSNLVADVSYDLWLSNVAGSNGATSQSTYEIMIWLSARGGATPAGSPLTTVNINGVNWKVWKGTVQSWTIFSFVAPSEITNFNSDLKPFFTYLTNSQGVPSSQLLVQAQAGTEPFVGSATLNTNSYSLTIN
ncbi:hypothetical protein D9613_003315 [Agrocybe pediades]|uniref:Glycoside hydrolase family 12 protein n=1 Tax=Agrocybe pediades TaxID=84607 RepID=A0A8H4VKS7_9AGAR|nr:hypothetical protein D9613_003315 [Agrocybe pediades]KAF9557191.1 glycoside hydrolase family 12 protein [Agrocybe pediades]